ncbi:TPA: single-stranded-DNA-specific exonuclease RecJ [bacterium]|nr:single-stranded-DNA-specific exonuclease RecJ [bacterium]
MSEVRWRTIETKEDDLVELSQGLDISPILARLLINRGVLNLKDARSFLKPNLSDLKDPFLFEEMELACQRVHRALDLKEKILIFGDWDVDGLAATALLVRFIRQLGGEVYYHIPKDFGYGLDKETLHKAHQQEIKLIITVDCGISNYEEIKYASSLGIDTIITDHHPPLIETDLPALTVINPKDSLYPDKDLAGVGVAFKLGQALLASYQGRRSTSDPSSPRMDYYFRAYLDLVALGTVADSVQLTGENRILTKFGLERFRETKKVGLKVLLHSLRLFNKEIGEWEVAFKLAPVLNAAGRMNQGHLGIELLITKEKGKAVYLAQKILSLNEARRLRSDLDTRLAIEYIEREIDLDREKVLVVPLEECEAGVTGIVANRLLERYLRPVVIFACMGDEAIGSARSNNGLDLDSILPQCDDLFIKFGGHRMAAGITITKKNISLFRERINSLVQEISLETQEVVIDHVISLDEITPALLDDIDRLRPFGEGNPEPTFLIQDIRPAAIKRIGKRGEHLKIILSSQKREGYLEVVGWRMGNLNDRDLSRANLVVKLKKNYWNGKEQVQPVIEKVFCKPLDSPLPLTI